jgi:ferric-dicitrate binding protein FerR (iron transport regulator)
MVADRQLTGSERERALDDLGQLARESLTDDTSDLVHAAGKRRLRSELDRIAESAGRRRPSVFLVWTAAAALATLIAFFILRAPSAPAALSFEVDPKLAQGEYLQPPAVGPHADVRFSDGSQLRLDAGGRARVASTTADGARLVLERGHAELHVVHRPNTRWSFDAGPYTVRVTGTRFTVDWSSEQETLQVVVSEGSVMVQSSGRQEGIAVTAGQRLVATAKDARFELGPSSVGARHALDPSTALRARAGSVPQRNDLAIDPPQTVNEVDTQRAVLAPNDDTWTQRVAAGDFSSVIGAAQSRGIDTVLTQAVLPDLVALADAARYTGNTSLAQRALQAQRNRFAGSSSSRAAAFLMGRIAEDREHDAQSALSWYNTYLSEAPQGAFAAEALGRRLVLLERSAGAAAARDSARSYLRRFPDGPYARVAQQILSAP